MDCRVKECTSCKKELPVTNFYKSNSKKSGYKSHCKECVKERSKANYHSPEQNKRRIENHWRTHGLDMTVEKYDALFEQQNGKCGICGTNKNRNNSRFCVDHCHTTGKIRGLLCHDCNTSIGKLGDSKEGLMKAIEYLDNALESEDV